MNNYYRTYSCPYWDEASRCNQDYAYNDYGNYGCPYFCNPYIPFENTEMNEYSRCAYRQMQQMQQPEQMQQMQQLAS